jgi:two-component system, sensor histidine kinase
MAGCIAITRAYPLPEMRIIVAEDQTAEAAKLVRLLSALGHQVQVTTSGQATVAACLRETPEVALVDLLLPGLDGFEVARQVRAGGGHATRLVAITGLRDPAAADVARASGFVEVLHKPYTSEDLRALLDRIAAARQANGTEEVTVNEEARTRR